MLQAAGIAVAFVGVVLAAREQSAGEHHEAPSRKAIGLSLAAALAIGLNYVCYAYAARYDPYWGIFIARSTSIGIFDTGSNGLFSVASTLGYLSVVSVLSAAYPVFTIILAHLSAHERLARLQQAGVAAALVGVGMIAAG